MTPEEIRKTFALDPADGKTLTSQLEGAISRFIESHCDGTFLPPEEQLARDLNVSRVTVRNALKKFLEAGQIQRQAGKGTRICKQTISPWDINPLAWEQLYFPRQRRPLRFLVLETLPYQQKYWEAVCAAFNEQNSSQVEIIYLDSLTTDRKISGILQEQNIDLFLYLHNLSEKISSLAAPLPDDLRNRAGSGDFMPCFDSFWQESMYDYLLPLNLSISVLAWNKNLELSAGLDIEALLKKHNVIDVFKEAALHLPREINAAGHAWDIISRSGCPSQENELSYLERKIAQLADLLLLPNAAITHPNRNIKDLITDFYNQKILFFGGTRTNLYALGDYPFELREKLLYPEPGCKNLLMSLNIAVSRFSPRQSEAAVFLEHLLSEEIQELCGSIKKIPPLRKKNFFNFMEREFGSDQTESLNWLSKHELFIHPARHKESYFGFLTFEIRDEIELLASKKLSVRETFERIKNKYIQPEYLYTSNGI